MTSIAKEFEIHGVKVEITGPDPDDGVILEQDNMGETAYVTVHPSTIRLIAERLGMLPAGDAEAQRTIARLCRQMRVLNHRIQEHEAQLLRIWEKGHEDVGEEAAYAEASSIVAREFITELPDIAPPSLPDSGSDRPPTGNPPKSGAVAAGNPPNSGGVPPAYPPKSGPIAGPQQLPLSPGA